jgi:hypothetical protein
MPRVDRAEGECRVLLTEEIKISLTLEPCLPCPALRCLPCLDQENLARLRVVDFGSGLWTLDFFLLPVLSRLYVCCPKLDHSLTPSRPKLWHAAVFHRYPTLSRLAPLSLSLWILDQTRRSWRLQLCEGFFAQAKTLDLGILEPVEQSCWVCTLQAAGVSGTRPPLLCVLQALKRA